MSRPQQWLSILAAAVLLAAAQVLLKTGMQTFSPRALGARSLLQLIVHIATTPIVLLGYVIGFGAGLFWLLVLARLDLSIALPILTGLYFTLMLVCTQVLLGERVSPRRWLGSLIILIGIALMSTAG